MDSLDALSAEPGTLRLGGRVFVIAPPTPGDMVRIAKRMRDMARARTCSPPLAHVAALKDVLPPDVFAQALREAIQLGAAGGSDPTESAVRDQFGELDGVRWQVWYFCNRADRSVTPDDVSAWVSEDDRFRVADDLNAALGMGAEKKLPTPPPITGS